LFLQTTNFFSIFERIIIINHYKKYNIMKKLLLMFLIPALSFMASCGGSDGDGIMSQMKQLKKVADNAKEMQKEIEANPEDQDKIFTDNLLDAMHLTASGRLITDEEWEQASKAIDSFLNLDSAQMSKLNAEIINEIFVNEGYDNMEQGIAEFEKLAKLSSFVQGSFISFMELQVIRLMEGKEAYEKQAKLEGEKINEMGYSPNDLRAIEKYAEYPVKAVLVLTLINNYELSREAIALADSLSIDTASIQQIIE